MNYEVVPARALHIKPMAEKLRPGAIVGMVTVGISPRRALHDAVRHSIASRAMIIDGAIEAIWGIVAPLLSDAAYVWLAVSEKIRELPRFAAETARAQMIDMASGYGELRTTLLPDDSASIGFADFLGFRGAGCKASKMTRRHRIAALLDDDANHIGLPDGHLILVHWRKDV